jgi:hypothetical protein
VWIRIIDYYHACLYVQQLAEALYGPGPKSRAWAKAMRQHLKTKSNGITRVLQSASALRLKQGLWGKPQSYDQAYAYLKKRTHWMRYRHYSSQRLPIGSGITEAACKIVFTQRLKRSGMSWTIEGGQTILDLRVIWLSGVWGDVYQRYLASKPMPTALAEMATGAQCEPQALSVSHRQHSHLGMERSHPTYRTIITPEVSGTAAQAFHTMSLVWGRYLTKKLLLQHLPAFF